MFDMDRFGQVSDVFDNLIDNFHYGRWSLNRVVKGLLLMVYETTHQRTNPIFQRLILPLHPLLFPRLRTHSPSLHVPWLHPLRLRGRLQHGRPNRSHTRRSHQSPHSSASSASTLINYSSEIAKPKRIDRSDWLCLLHGGVVADFTKSHWGTSQPLKAIAPSMQVLQRMFQT
ncbi:hypothetical protein BC829DRAFT_226846 [Chytridium lagenaria]|nr:hypothetical protein BC829DRAFT_226846 [Chytridium lagenaria]